MDRFSLAIDRVDAVDWSTCLKAHTSDEARDSFMSFLQEIVLIRNDLGLTQGHETGQHLRFPEYFASISQKLHPEMHTPQSVISLCERVSTRIKTYGGIYSILGCKAYVMWELMIQQYGPPALVSANPYDLLLKFFESGGMYKTEHGMLMGFV